MNPIVVSDVMAVGEYPTPEQLEILAKAGFKSVINNQPDGEIARFPPGAEAGLDAKRHGLAYAFAPIESRTPSPEELATFARAVHELPAPIYAYCYSGARSAAACAFLLAEHKDADAIIADFARFGFDIEALRPWLAEARAKTVPPQPTAAAPASAAPAHAASEPPAPVTMVAAVVAGANGTTAIAAPEAAPSAIAAAAPKPIVIYPRAYGSSGFAM